jgi:hypothetical protein
MLKIIVYHWYRKNNQFPELPAMRYLGENALINEIVYLYYLQEETIYCMLIFLQQWGIFKSHLNNLYYFIFLSIISY